MTTRRTCGLPDCTRPHRRNGLCDLHDQRMRRAGTTVDPIKLTFTERFWSKVDRRSADDCWPWQGPLNRYGYGTFADYSTGRRKWLYAHRLAFQLTTGLAIDGKVIRHACDNPPCVNPAHLEPGTQAQNVADAKERGRCSPPPIHRGSDNKMARLTEADVREIRRRHAAGGVTQKALAREFKVSPSTVRDVISRRRWDHVNEDEPGGTTPRQRWRMQQREAA